MADHNARIVISADAKGVQATTDELVKMGKVDKQNADQFKKHHEESKKRHHEQIDFNTKLTHSFEELAEGIVAAFAVEKIIEWGQEAVKAFEEAQQATSQLRFAVENLAGGDHGAFKELEEQSESLSKSLNNLFTPKQIQQSQTMLLRMKLNTEQVAQLMPRIADIAAKTGKDLNSVAEGFGRAISEGNTKALTEFGLKFKDTGTVVGNFNKIMESSAKYIGGAADAMGDLANQEKEAANKAELLQEEVGSKLAPVWVGLKNAVLESVDSLFEFLKVGESIKEGDWKDVFAKYVNALTINLIHLETTQEEVEALTKMSHDRLLVEYRDNINALKKAQEEHDIDEIKRLLAKRKVISEILTKGHEGEKKEQEGIDKDLRDNKDKANAMSIDQLKKYQKLVLENEQNFSVTGFEQEKSAIENAIKLQEEAGKKKADKRKADYEKELKEMEEFERKAFEEMVKDDQERTANEVEINNLHLKRVEQTMEAELEAQKLALAKKRNAGKISSEDYEKELTKLENKNRIERDRLELDQIKENNQIKAEELKRERDMNVISEEQYQKKLLEMEVERGEKELQLQKDLNKETYDLKKDSEERVKKLIEGFMEISEKIFESITEHIEATMQGLDTQLDHTEKNIEIQKTLAEKGLHNELAFEERRADEIAKKKLDEEKKLRKVKELETFLNSLAKFSEENPNTALDKALAMLAATKTAEALFLEEGGIAGLSSQKTQIGLSGFSRRHRGGDMLALLSPREGVIPESKMSEWGLNTQERFSNFLRTPFKEKVIPTSRFMPVLNDEQIVSQLQELKEIVKNKREISVDWEGWDLRITTVENGLKNVVTHKRRGI